MQQAIATLNELKRLSGKHAISLRAKSMITCAANNAAEAITVGDVYHCAAVSWLAKLQAHVMHCDDGFLLPPVLCEQINIALNQMTQTNSGVA